MELERNGLVPPIQEIPVIEGELVATLRELAGRGVGSKTIARPVGVARNTVRRYTARPAADRRAQAGARRHSRARGQCR